MKKKLIFLALMIVLILSVCTATVFAANETANLKITAANLSLENAVYMNFKVTHENISRENVKLLVWEECPEAYTKGTEDACLSAKTDADGNTVFQYTDLSAKEMTKLVYVCAYAKIGGTEYYSTPVKYSIAIYANRMKATSQDTEFLNLIDAMLEYGALSQKYFKYNTDNLPTTEFYQINANGGIFEDNFNIGWYQSGATATLTANTPEDGYRFLHWENDAGEMIAETETIEITINGNESYYAVYEEITSEGLLYELSEDKSYYAVIGKGDCPDTKLVIPSEHDGLPVWEIRTDAFYECDTITSVKIPNTILEIQDRAFYSCNNLWNVIFEENSSVNFIGWDAFLDCDSLISIEIPNSVTYMSNGVFARCQKLKTVTFEDGIQLEMLPIDIFNDCPSLTDVTLPDSLISIEDRAFYKCPSLEAITIPENVTRIGSGAFYGCTGLKAITLPEGVTDFGAEGIFGDCTALESINLPKGITAIGDFTFTNCTNLYDISFSGTREEWVAIPKGEAWNRGISDYFVKCTDDWDYRYVRTTYYEYTISDNGRYYIITHYYGEPSKEGELLVVDIPTEYYDIYIKEIGEWAFSGIDNVWSYVFADDSQVFKIGESAFRGCKELRSVENIPAEVLTIEARTFANNSNFTGITFADNAKISYIGDEAFLKCKNLFTFSIPKTVTYVSTSAFSGCEMLVSISVPNPNITSIGAGSATHEKAFYFPTIFFNGTLEQWFKIEGSLSISGRMDGYKIDCIDGDIIPTSWNIWTPEETD